MKESAVGWETSGTATGDHSTSNSSPSLPARPTSASCSALTGRVVIEPTDRTGSPSPSASSMDTELGPTGAILARTDDAPAACSDTCCQEKGSASS
ncbi:hypothetical protein TUM20984_01380 [Mycobacterium antarcticum]|nr:hypothetical protein TUM20984_01380 [Mycolicibacterium sp. TUM20984]